METETERFARYLAIDRRQWSEFFDLFTHALEGKRVEIEVVGLDLGDQIEAEWLPLFGLTYDRKADTLYVYTEDVEADLDHAIPSPRAIHAQFGARGLERVIAIDGDGRQHIVHLRDPLALPSP